MTVTQRLLKQGQFTLGLAEQCPPSIYQTLSLMGHIVVTPAWINPQGLSDANILACSVFTGPLVQKSPTELSGPDLVWWVSDDNGVGDVIEGVYTFTAGTLSQWVTGMLPTNGITAGTITNTGTNLTHSFYLIARRDALNYICHAVGAEWRINADGTVDAAAPGTLFADYTTPTTIAIRSEGSTVTGDLKGLAVVDMSHEDDASDFTTKVILVAQGDGKNSVTATASSGVTNYKGFGGATAIRERMVDSPQTVTGNASSVAAASLNLYKNIRQKVTLSTDTYLVTRFVTPGSSLYVFDLKRGLYDTAVQVLYRGTVMAPVRMRVLEVTWPVVQGMGVYYRSQATPPVYTDLTPHIAFDSGETSYNVASLDYPVWGDVLPTSRTGRAANEDIYERMNRGGTLTYTPVITQLGTVAYTLVKANYYVVGSLVVCAVCMNVTGAGTANNAILVSLPMTAAVSGTDFGSGSILDTSAARRYPVLTNLGSTTTVRFQDATQALNAIYTGQTGAAMAAGLANGDQINFTFIYEAA